MNKARLNLSPLEGDEECFLEIEFDDNSDAFINIRGQDEKGEMQDVRAQIPNPVNGGGNLASYNTIRHLYGVIKNYGSGKGMRYEPAEDW